MVGKQGALFDTGEGVVNGFDKHGNPLILNSDGTHVILEIYWQRLNQGCRTGYDVLRREGKIIYGSSMGYEAKSAIDIKPHTDEEGVGEAVTGIQTLLDKDGERLPSGVRRKLEVNLGKVKKLHGKGKYSRAANQAGNVVRLLEKGSSNGAGEVYSALQTQYQSLVRALGR